MSRGNRPALRATLLAALTLVLAAGVSGCANKRLTTGSVDRRTTPVAQMTEADLDRAVERYGKAYVRNPKSRDTALAYAEVLSMTNRTNQALAVMRKTAIYHPRDRAVLAAYGKALASVGKFDTALDAIRRAQTPEYPDWKLVSAEAAILDQLGKPDEARTLYSKALDIKPDEPSILSNFGMSHVLTGDLKTAETYLRKAVGMPGADSRVRQNLALVVGLQGRFAEAEQIAAQELSREQAEANVAYLRSILAQQNSWQKLADAKDKKG